MTELETGRDRGHRGIVRAVVTMGLVLPAARANQAHPVALLLSWLRCSRGCSVPRTHPRPPPLACALRCPRAAVRLTKQPCVEFCPWSLRPVSLLLRGDSWLLLRGDSWLASQGQAWPCVSFQCHLSDCSSRSEPRVTRPRGFAALREWLMTPTPGSTL